MKSIEELSEDFLKTKDLDKYVLGMQRFHSDKVRTYLTYEFNGSVILHSEPVEPVIKMV